MTYYLTTLLVYAAVDAMACLAISLQFGLGSGSVIPCQSLAHIIGNSSERNRREE